MTTRTATATEATYLARCHSLALRAMADVTAGDGSPAAAAGGLAPREAALLSAFNQAERSRIGAILDRLPAATWPASLPSATSSASGRSSGVSSPATQRCRAAAEARVVNG